MQQLRVPQKDRSYLTIEEIKRLCEYVLTGAGGRKIYTDYLAGRFKQYVHKAGLNPKLHFHHLRHSFATLLVQDGAPIYELKELLGHKDIKTTQIYSHMEVDTLRGAVARLDKLELSVCI